MEGQHAHNYNGRITSSSLSVVGEYHGRRGEDPVAWIQKLNRLAQPMINNWDGRAKMVVALTMLCDDAGLWAHNINENMPWEKFEHAFLERFSEPIEEAMARLAKCQQGRHESIQNYTDRFKKDAILAGRDEDRALIHHYMEGMHCYLKQEVLRQGNGRMQGIDCICRFLRTIEADLAHCDFNATNFTNIHDCHAYEDPNHNPGPSFYRLSQSPSWSNHTSVDHDDDRPWTDFCHLEAGDNRCASSHDHYPQNNMTNVSQLPRSTHYNGCYRYQSPDRTTRIQHVDDYSGDDCEAYASHFGAHDDT